MASPKGRRVYGAGILSSFGETNSSLQRDMEVHPFDIEAIISREFITSEQQSLYFELGSFEQLFESLHIFRHEPLLVRVQ